MELGQFSISLAAKDVKASLAFYEKFGFEVTDGGHINKDFPTQEGKDWRIIRKGTTMMGLFQGMFDENALTFNPPDVRVLQSSLKGQGVKFELEADETTTGPAAMLKIRMAIKCS